MVLPVEHTARYFDAVHITVLPQTPVAEKTVSRPNVLIELAEDHVVVMLAGEVDLAAQGDLMKAYQQAIALQAEPRIVVDLSGVTFMDSTALGTLVAAVKKVQARGGTLSVVGASDRIASLFHITKLDTVLPLCPEPRDASGLVKESS